MSAPIANAMMEFFFMLFSRVGSAKGSSLCGLALLWQIVDFVAFYRIPESIFQ